jgi:hypothetical protein
MVKINFPFQFITKTVNGENNANAHFWKICFNHPNRRNHVGITAYDDYLTRRILGGKPVGMKGYIYIGRLFFMFVKYLGATRALRWRHPALAWALCAFRLKFPKNHMYTPSFARVNENFVPQNRFLASPKGQGRKIVYVADIVG